MPHPEITIAGAGIIGLSLALELHRRGHTVRVLDRYTPLAEASTAAAGMLAVDDPENPPALHPLSFLSRSLYPAFVDHLHHLSSHRVPFQTHRTLQALPSHAHFLHVLDPHKLHHHLPSLLPSPLSFALLDEQSLDPRQLAQTLLAAIHATPIDLRTNTPVLHIHEHPHALELTTTHGRLQTSTLVDCTGAWSLSAPHLPYLAVTPRKGQMLALATPLFLDLNLVLRTPSIYLVPRTLGPHAGRIIVGATIEDAGFDKSIDATAIAHLHTQAANLLPELRHAEILETWAGLRPSTPDLLPILGPLPNSNRRFLATGHFRNGILLAPATAHLLADLLTGRPPALNLAPFSSLRQPAHPTSATPLPPADLRPSV